MNVRELVAIPLLGSFVISDQVKHASERFGEWNLERFEKERRSNFLHLGNVYHFVELVLNPLGVFLDAFAHFLTHSKAQLQITTFGWLCIFLIGRFVPSFHRSVFPNLFPPHLPVPSPIVSACRARFPCVLQLVKRNLQRVLLRQELRFHQRKV